MVDGTMYAPVVDLESARVRQFGSKLVKTTVFWFYDCRTPDIKTWANWRDWARRTEAYILKKLPADGAARKYSFLQFCSLVAIAQIRDEESVAGKYRELDVREIEAKANSPEFQEMMANLIGMVDREYVQGSEAYLALRPHGLNLTYKAVAHKVPGFKAREYYGIKDLIKWCS